MKHGFISGILRAIKNCIEYRYSIVVSSWRRSSSEIEKSHCTTICFLSSHRFIGNSTFYSERISQALVFKTFARKNVQCDKNLMCRHLSITLTSLWYGQSYRCRFYCRFYCSLYRLYYSLYCHHIAWSMFLEGLVDSGYEFKFQSAPSDSLYSYETRRIELFAIRPPKPGTLLVQILHFVITLYMLLQ